MNPRESRPAIVRIKGCLVYAGTPLCPLNVAFPQGVHRVTSLDGHSVAMTCAQMAIIPRNSANDASAAASSTTILNITPSVLEQNGNLVYGLFSVKASAPAY
jgi:hypothetical protein